MSKLNLDQVALDAATEIEALIAADLKGGAVQRKARIQVIVRGAMERAHRKCAEASRRMIHQLGAAATLVSDGLDDEGDRVYLESTNHAEVIKAAAGLYDDYRIEHNDVGRDVGIPG